MDEVSKLRNKKEEIANNSLNLRDSMVQNFKKMTAKERVLNVLDEGSFIEIGGMLKGSGGGVIGGYGTINRTLVYIYSQDFNVSGGTVDCENSKKICSLMDMAAKMGAPIIQIYDSIGFKLEEGLDVLQSYGNVIRRNATLSGVVPQIAVIAGSCTGIAAIGAVMSDFTIMVEQTGEMYINSPEKLMESRKEYVETPMYANFEKASENGNVQITAASENEAFNLVRKIMGYIPSNNLELPVNDVNSEISEVQEELNFMVNEGRVSTQDIIKTIMDKDSLIELNTHFAQEIIISLGKIKGITIGVVGESSINKGRLDIQGLNKMTRFIKFCDSFNIPLLFIVNNNGFVHSVDEEKKGLILEASKMLCCLSQTSVPKISLIVGKAYGAQYVLMADKNIGFDMVFSWPGSSIALTEPEIMVRTLYRDEILNSNNPSVRESELLNEHYDELASPYNAAEKGYIDDIIIPSETKIRLFSAFDMLQSKREINYPKKHGSMLI